MKAKSLNEHVNEIKDVKDEVVLHPMFQVKSFAWGIVGLAFVLMFIENFLQMESLVGGWHIVAYLLVLVPLAYMAINKQLDNHYVKWFLPLLVIMIVDMFYYSNDMVQYVLPIVFFTLVIVLYWTSMHRVHSLYQTLIPASFLDTFGISHLSQFFDNLLIKKQESDIYKRIGLALLITVPFLVVFVVLLFAADERFASFMTSLVDFNFDFEIAYLWTVPWYLFFYLVLFIATFSMKTDRTKVYETKAFDMLIVGIFLGMINLLFLMFVSMQLGFLLGEPNLPENTSLAEFTREGFFQLMMVMSLVLLIFIFIMRRYKNEKVAMFLLAGLLVQTILMGLVSLKKMYLYQSIKGATVLRYYVEWFDYFLITILFIGLVFLVRQWVFRKLLDVIVVVGLLSFMLVVSLNIDAMVASHNIEKFKENPEELDRRAISYLSIDALEAIQGTDLTIEYSKKRWCEKFSNYHLGYCSKLKAFGDAQYQFKKEKRYEIR